MDQRVKQTFDELKTTFLSGVDAQKIWDEASDIIEPTLRNWARAMVLLESGNDSQKRIAKQIIGSVERTMEEMKSLAKHTAVNYLWDRFADAMLVIVTRHLIPTLIAAI